MKMEVERSRIVILPENEQDKAYIEDTLGFKEEKEAIPCKGVALMGGTSIHSVFGDKRHEGKQRVKRRYKDGISWKEKTRTAEAKIQRNS